MYENKTSSVIVFLGIKKPFHFIQYSVFYPTERCNCWLGYIFALLIANIMEINRLNTKLISIYLELGKQEDNVSFVVFNRK